MESGVLCEDFESGTIDSATWTTTQTQGAAMVDDVHVHRGRYALHSHTDAATTTADPYAQLTETKTFPALQDGFYVRLFVYVSTPTADANITIIQESRMTTGTLLALMSGRLEFYEYFTMPDQFVTSATPFPFDAWACLEWNVSAGVSHTWLDGTELDDLSFTGIATDPLQKLSIGSHLASQATQPATDMWIDDVLVDTVPIGCTR